MVTPLERERERTKSMGKDFTLIGCDEKGSDW